MPFFGFHIGYQFFTNSSVQCIASISLSLVKKALRWNLLPEGMCVMCHPLIFKNRQNNGKQVATSCSLAHFCILQAK